MWGNIVQNTDYIKYVYEGCSEIIETPAVNKLIK